jgi:hypothetical protein
MSSSSSRAAKTFGRHAYFDTTRRSIAAAEEATRRSKEAGIIPFLSVVSGTKSLTRALTGMQKNSKPLGKSMMSGGI